MNEVELNEFRIARLAAAVDHVSQGNKTDFGRRLGYKDGAFVRQMISGIRPVTEKTIWAIETMPGMKGWFDTDGSIANPSPPSPAPWPFPGISEKDVRALPPAHINELQGALALAIAQLKLRVEVAPAPKTASSTRGSVVDTHAADDAFPMPAVLDHPATASGKILVSPNVTAGARAAANDSFEPVPELADVRLAAGDGIENHAEVQTGVIQFRRSFLRSVGADSGKARVVYAKGDSMEPVIKDGAALLVVANENLTLRDLAGGGVYAINYDGKMIVKTVAKDKLTGRWVARSANPAYPDIPLENGHPVRVLGQVVWAGARLRDNEAGQWIPATSFVG